MEAITAGDATDLHVADVRRLGGGFTRPVHAAAARRDQPYQPYLLVAGSIVPQPELAPVMWAAVDGLTTAMRSYDSGRAPYNFGRDAELVYPPDVLERLRDVNRRVDRSG